MIDKNNYQAHIEILASHRASGRSRGIGDFPILEEYFKDTNEYPFIKSFSGVSIIHTNFVASIEPLSIRKVFQRETIDKELSHKQDHVVFQLAKGYFIELSSTYSNSENYELDLDDLLSRLKIKDNADIQISNVVFLCPPDNSSFKDPKLESTILELVKINALEDNNVVPRIGMICSDGRDFFIKDFFLKKDYTLHNSELHYGKGFTEFHVELIKRFKEDSKGLVLFHGLPGTGKCVVEDTYVTVKNNITGKIENITIKEFRSRLNS